MDTGHTEIKARRDPGRMGDRLDEDFQNVLQTGQATTFPNRDYTVKVVVHNLQPATKYYYRFKSLDRYSQTGTTKTLPAGDEPVKLAFMSCSNIEWGHFNWETTE